MAKPKLPYPPLTSTMLERALEYLEHEQTMFMFEVAPGTKYAYRFAGKKHRQLSDSVCAYIVDNFDQVGGEERDYDDYQLYGYSTKAVYAHFLSLLRERKFLALLGK